MKKQLRRAFCLHLQRSGMTVLEAEHGALLEVPPLALAQGKNWTFGVGALKSSSALHLFDDAGFPLKAYLQWVLERFYPLKKIELLLLVPGQHKLMQSLWFCLLQELSLASFTLGTPLDCLIRTLKTGVFVYLEDGLASLAVCQQGHILESTSVGYGHFLTRAMRHQVQTAYGLRIESETAARVWQKLSSGGTQVTVTGETFEGKLSNQMLILEDLKGLLVRALQPLIQEVAYLQALYPHLDCFLLGRDAENSGLQEVLKQCLDMAGSRAAQIPESLERLLQNSIQYVLQESQL